MTDPTIGRLDRLRTLAGQALVRAGMALLPDGVFWYPVAELVDDFLNDPTGADHAYRNDRWPDRDCDHCGRPYRGPAVYCSRRCALADAGPTFGVDVNPEYSPSPQTIGERAASEGTDPMPRYRYKTDVVVDAFRLPKMSEDVPESFYVWAARVGFDQWESGYNGSLVVHSPHGARDANPGDWIVKGLDGIFYPVAPALFDQLFEALRPDGRPPLPPSTDV